MKKKINTSLLSFLALVATVTVVLSCGSKQTLAGSKWEATERDELRGGIINLAIEFSSDSTGHFYLVSFDLGDGLVEKNDDHPFTYTYDAASKNGRINIKDDKNVYPFSLNDTALLYPSILNWQPVPYKQMKK